MRHSGERLIYCSLLCNTRSSTSKKWNLLLVNISYKNEYIFRVVVGMHDFRLSCFVCSALHN